MLYSRPASSSKQLSSARGLATSLVCAVLLGACGGGGENDDAGASTTNVVTTVDMTMGTTGTSPNPTETGDPFPGCDGIDIAQDGVLDLDIAVLEYVVVTGSIRVNGGALPDADGSRGAIVFETTPAKGPPSVFTYTLDSAGAEDYSLVLPAGSVTVRYLPDAGLCAASPEGPLPCTGGVLIPTVNILADGVLDLDIPAVTVSGKVTQNGAVMPDDVGDRGHIEFVGAAGELVATAGFEAAGPVTYAVALFPGTYDVSFAGNAALCSEGAAKVPCNRGELQHGVALQASGVLDLDVSKVDVTGVVTVNGAVVPDGTGDRGAIRLRPAAVEGGGEILSQPFGATGPVDYALSVVAGSYVVELAANPAQCNGEPPVTPCVGGIVVATVKLVASGVLDVDVPMIEVSGKVTLGGAALPDAAGDRGSLLFTRGAAEGVPVALGAADPVDYVLGLIPGSYTISYVANSALCDGIDAPAVPCTGGPLQTLKLTATGVLDVDIPAVKVSGAITLNGAALQSQPASRGSLLFANGAGSAVGVSLGSDGPVDYALTVLPGDYGVSYVADGACMGAPDNFMPCGGGGLLAGIGLAMDGVLDLDIPKIAISGAITYGAAPLPDLQESRGTIRWSRLDNSGALAIDLGADGSVQYDVPLMPGRWIIEHGANPELCADGAPNFPCTDQVIHGCSAP
ncbi:MAG: hypothetical protein H0T76_15220 [Nannocystis sp.]|nr:hypothetical protein [Nannocystis sp.]MBA3547832.1 hypothetical protein [Nannocystis sp.]